jgi:hypothetical protein
MRNAALLGLALLLPGCAAPPGPGDDTADVAVYGATPGGICAALAAAREGRRVLLLEPGGRLGGMVTHGLSHTDFRTFEGITGIYLEFTRRVLEHYRKTYGPDSIEARDCFRGTQAEPSVNLAVFEAMIAEQAGLRVRRGWRLARVVKEGLRIVALEGSGPRAAALVFIDGTYEGDLMAAAGVPWRVGREARSEYGESLAPEQADGQLQAYNFRLILTQDPARRLPLPAPPGYRREDFLDVLPLLRDGRLKSVFCENTGGIYKAQKPAPARGVFDINDVSRGLVRLSLPGANLGWPDGDAAARQAIFQEHLRHNTGLLHFLQNDPEVPERFRQEAGSWGLVKDEFPDTGHLPGQLYVREARRMIGMRVFTERDVDHAAGDARAVFHRDSIGMGDYGPNCHGTAHEGPRIGGRHTGEFYKPVPPYQIPYGTIVPKEVPNLLVPVAASTSHVGFCALRLEPIWGSMGQAAGVAAHHSILRKRPVQELEPAEIQSRLHAAGAATIYVSDVLPGDPDFAAVQALGMRGGLHGRFPAPETPGRRGAKIAGQYYEAYPGHAAR